MATPGVEASAPTTWPPSTFTWAPARPLTERASADTAARKGHDDRAWITRSSLGVCVSALLQRLLDERAHVLAQPGQLAGVDVHHVPGLVEAGAEVALEARVQAQVAERVFGGEVGRGQVVVAGGHEEPHVRVLGERAAQRLAGVGEHVVAAEVPALADAAAQDVVGEVALEV